MRQKISENATGFVPLTRQRRALILLAIASMIAGIGLGNLLLGDAHQLLPFLSLFFFALVLAAPLVFYRRGWGVFHPLIFAVLWFGIFHEVIRKIPLFTIGLDTHFALPGLQTDGLSEIVAYGTFLTALGFVAMYFGYLSSPRPRVPKLAFGGPSYLILKVSLVAVFSTLALLVLANEMGGIGRLALQRGLRSDMRAAALVGGHWVVLVGMLETACLVWLALRPQDWKRPLFIVFFIFALAIGFIATGSRSGVIMPLIIAAVILTFHTQQIPYIRAIVIGLLGLVALGMLGEFRSQSRGAQGLYGIELDSGLIQSAEQGLDSLAGSAGRFSGLYGIVGRVPNQVDHLYGYSYLSIPAAPIPSRLWEEKPMAGGRLTGWLIFERDRAGGGVPPGNIGEAYWNFGIPGVILIMFLFGMVLRWLGAFYMANNGASWVVVIYVISLFSLQPNSVSFYSWLHAIVPVIAFLVFFTGLPRQAKPRSTLGTAGRAFSLVTKNPNHSKKMPV